MYLDDSLTTGLEYFDERIASKGLARRRLSKDYFGEEADRRESMQGKGALGDRGLASEGRTIGEELVSSEDANTTSNPPLCFPSLLTSPSGH